MSAPTDALQTQQACMAMSAPIDALQTLQACTTSSASDALPTQQAQKNVGFQGSIPDAELFQT